MSNPRQIVKYSTNKYLIEFIDNLQTAKPEQASNIHGKYSRIKAVALDYSQGIGDKKTIAVDANLDALTLKYLAEMIINNPAFYNLSPEKPIKAKLFSEQKILSHALDDKGMAKVTIFTIMYDSSRNYCWQIIVENGLGKPQKQSTGGIAVEKGSYKKDKQVQVYMSDIDFKKHIVKVRDYILAWETIHLRSLLKERTKYEDQNSTRVPLDF